MKSIFLVVFTLIGSFIFMGNGCGKRTYYQLITYDAPTPLVFEVVKDTTRFNSFVGLDFMHFSNPYPDENIQIARLTYQNSNTKKFSVTNLNFQVFAGNYRVSGIDGVYSQDSIYNGNKFGLGGRASISMGINFNIKGFRIGLGIEPSLNLDFGEYLNFRKNASNDGVIESNDDFIKLYLNIFPYLSIPFGKSTILNLQTNVGMPGGFSPIISLQVENSIVWISYLNQRTNVGYMLNYDLVKSIF